MYRGGFEQGSDKSAIRVLVADDHCCVRVAVSELLGSSGIAVVGSACDGEEAVTLSAIVEPDLVLMDLAMPVLDGVEATRRILAANPRTRVLAFTAVRDRRLTQLALAAGAVACLPKDTEPGKLVESILKACA